jgi:hypothetical protein
MNHLLKYSDVNLYYITKVDESLKRDAEKISKIVDISTEEHVKTSCYYTAMLIRWLVSNPTEWVRVDSFPDDEIIYQVVFGEDEEDDQHYLTVFESNLIFQSYWRKYELTRTTDSDIKKLLTNFNEDNWMKLTNVENEKAKNYKCFYYKPKNRYNDYEFLRKLHYLTHEKRNL